MAIERFELRQLRLNFAACAGLTQITPDNLGSLQGSLEDEAFDHDALLVVCSSHQSSDRLAAQMFADNQTSDQ